MSRSRDMTAGTTDDGDRQGMESSSQGKAALMASIESDAQAEIARILQDAADQVAQRGQYTDKKIESMFNEAQQKATKQGQAIQDKAIAQAELEIKRRRLQARTQIVGRLMSMVEEKLGCLIGDDSYREVLIRWIAEAALGLGVDTASVNASAEERTMIDASLMAEVQARVQQAKEQEMAVRLADEPALLSQGVILTAENGRTAYNNQVKTRLLRQQRAVHRLIHDTLFAGEE